MTHDPRSNSPRPSALAAASALAALVAVLCLCAEPLLAQDWKGRGRLQGKVTDVEGEPIAGAKVHILFRGEDGPEPVTTKKNGRWAYMGLASGAFDLRIEAEGYVGSEGSVRVNEYAPGAGSPIDTTLRKATAKADPNAESDRLMGVLEQGNQLLVDGDYAGARARFEEVRAKLEDDKQAAQLDRAIAVTYLEGGQTAEARRRFETLLAATEDPAQRADLLRSIARSHYLEEDVDASVAALEKAVEASPEDPLTLRVLVDTLVAAGREAEAEPYMARLPEGEKIDPNAMLNLGIAAYNEGDMATAIEKFVKVTDAYPDNANAHYYLGLAYMGSMENAKAKTHLEKMLEVEPEHPNAAEAKQFLEYVTSQQ